MSNCYCISVSTFLLQVNILPQYDKREEEKWFIENCRSHNHREIIIRVIHVTKEVDIT